MKIKMNNINLYEIYKVFGVFCNCSGKIGYVASKNRSRMRGDAEAFDEFRKNLIGKYGVRNDETGEITIEPNTENFQKFLDEFQPVADDMVEIDYYQISQEEFANSDYYVESATGRDYEILEAIIVQRKNNDDKSEESN